MSQITPFAGLTALLPAEGLSQNGYAFQSIDRYIIDRLLKVGAVTHRHDGHAAMADPTATATATAGSSGGSIPSNLNLYVTYTLLDQDGGETLPAPMAPRVSMGSGYQAPYNPPNAVADYAAGTLLADNYSYALTITDGQGGETALGPAAAVTLLSGYANGEVALSGFTALTNTASGNDPAAGWRLWRSQGGAVWHLIGTGSHTVDSLTDNGIVGDCTVAPPAVGSTAGGNVLHVTVPTSQPSQAVLFNVYVSLDGTFTPPCLLGTYPISQAGVAQTFTALNVSDAAPPKVSTALPGANLITTADLALNWLPPVATQSVLPLSGNHDGDARVALDTDTIYVWHAATHAWVASSGSGGGGPLSSSQEPGSYTLALSDASTVVEFTSASPTNVTIPPNSTINFPIGTVIEIFQYGVGQITIVAPSGVTLRSYNNLTHTAGLYATIGLRQRALNEWVLTGNLV
jgi:hypothetical protein